MNCRAPCRRLRLTRRVVRSSAQWNFETPQVGRWTPGIKSVAYERTFVPLHRTNGRLAGTCVPDARPKAPRVTVAERWGLPRGSPFVGIPHAALAAIWGAGARPYDERVLIAVLLGWRWGSGSVGRISIRAIARTLGTNASRRSIERSLLNLAECGLISYFAGGHGRRAEIDLSKLLARTGRTQPPVVAATGRQSTGGSMRPATGRTREPVGASQDGVEERQEAGGRSAPSPSGSVGPGLGASDEARKVALAEMAATLGIQRPGSAS